MHGEFRFPEPPSRLDAAPLYVSLFLVLLVFFIVLNAISKPAERKTERVLAGVSARFAEQALRETPPAPSPSGMPLTAEEEAGNRLAGQLKALGRSYLEIAEIDVAASGDQAAMRLPALTLFTVKGALRASRAPMLAALADAAKTWQQPYRLEIACILQLRPDADENARARAVAQAASLARTLVARGLAPKSVSAGIVPGDPRELRLVFTLRPADAKWPAPAPTGGGPP